MSAVLKIIDGKRTCRICRTEKLISEFQKHANYKHGYASKCRECQKPDGSDKHKICTECKIEKHVSQFHTSARGLYGYKAKCADCCNDISRETYKTNPDVRRSGIKNRPDKLQRLYGVTWQDVELAFSNQHGLCANRACGREMVLEGKIAPNRAVIDHCHDTGKFRALLCAGCNAILGTIETKKNLLLGLMEYKEKYTK